MTLDAVVVGAGPNGLAAAALLARAGFGVEVLEATDEPGGGARTHELMVAGLMHDDCSAVHPFAVASPVFRTLELEQHGLIWRHAPVDIAHPLDDGSAGTLYQDLERTIQELGADGESWRRLVGRASRRFDDIVADILRPLLAIPRHPTVTIPHGLRSLLPATAIARRLKTPQARGLWAGISAHAFADLAAAGTAGVGLAMVASGHAVGWPVPQGGSRSITSALVSALQAHGGTVHTGVRVTSYEQLPAHRVALLDLTPSAAATILGDRMPRRRQQAYRRFRHGPAAFKVDFAVRGGVPWTAEACRQAGTVHIGGTFEEISLAEREVVEGRMPERPFLLVAQSAVADPTREVDGLVPIWSYAHVPHGWPGDATSAIEDQIERFAPGFRDRIVGRHVRTPADLEAYNANNIGGDIAGGATSLRQVVGRPILSANPYDTGVPGVFLCSASTPPGAGVHGLCGAHAARAAVRVLSRS